MLVNTNVNYLTVSVDQDLRVILAQELSWDYNKNVT